MEPEHIAKSAGCHGDTTPPLETWHPELTGDMDLTVTRDGRWLYQGHPIPRESAIRLFSRILRREEDGQFYLVTPVEKWRIQVEDTPLLAYSPTLTGEGEDQVLSVTTNMGETLEIGPQHPLQVGQYPETDEPRPVVLVREGIEARLPSAAFYQLVDLAEERELGGERWLGVVSQRKFWKIGQHG